MERSTLMWLGGGAVALAAVVAAGVMMGDDHATGAPPTPPPAPVATTPAPAHPTTPPPDARVPDEAPTEVADDAWVTTASGLRYADLVVGEGAEVQDDSTVVLEYTGWLADDLTMFDSSKRRARPLIFNMDAAPLPGWAEAVRGMRGGGRRQAILPPELAYGQQGRPPRVPRDATVIFEFQLMRVQAHREPPPAPPTVEASAFREIAPGLRVADLVVGEGREVQPGDAVAIDYTGWLSNGRRFDSSLERPMPSTFEWGRGEMVAGVERGMTGMRVGGQRIMIVPPDLGYGERGRRGFVPPNETLTFVVELVDAAPL